MKLIKIRSSLILFFGCMIQGLGVTERKDGVLRRLEQRIDLMMNL
jgi:hypothetical protein